MKSNKIKKIFEKYFPFILIILFVVITIVIYIYLPKVIAAKVFITLFIISIALRIIIEILSKTNQIKLSINNKIDTIKELYNLFNLEKSNTIVAINTTDEKVLARAKKLFPGSRETKQKDIYSILLPKVTLKAILLFLKDNDPDRIIIHQFNKQIDNKLKSINRSISICIDEILIIQYSKNTFTKEEIKDIKEKLSKK